MYINSTPSISRSDPSPPQWRGPHHAPRPQRAKRVMKHQRKAPEKEAPAFFFWAPPSPDAATSPLLASSVFLSFSHP